MRALSIKPRSGWLIGAARDEETRANARFRFRPARQTWSFTLPGQLGRYMGFPLSKWYCGSDGTAQDTSELTNCQ